MGKYRIWIGDPLAIIAHLRRMRAAAGIAVALFFKQSREPSQGGCQDSIRRRVMQRNLAHSTCNSQLQLHEDQSSTSSTATSVGADLRSAMLSLLSRDDSVSPHTFKAYERLPTTASLRRVLDAPRSCPWTKITTTLILSTSSTYACSYVVHGL